MIIIVRVCALCPVPCALCPVPCALCPVPCALCPVPCALCPVPCALCPVPCALCPVPCALCPVPCALCPVPCALCPVPVYMPLCLSVCVPLCLLEPPACVRRASPVSSSSCGRTPRKRTWRRATFTTTRAVAPSCSVPTRFVVRLQLMRVAERPVTVRGALVPCGGVVSRWTSSAESTAST
jgi:hypothetical protein